MLSALVWKWLQFCNLILKTARWGKASLLASLSDVAAWVIRVCEAGDLALYDDSSPTEEFVYTVCFAFLLFFSLAFLAGFFCGQWVTLRNRQAEAAPALLHGLADTLQDEARRSRTPPARLLRRQLTDPLSPARSILDLLNSASNDAAFPVPLASPRAAPQAKGEVGPL